ncbi:MAG TPA: FtsX-like permease family protein [Rhodoblastus sp.]|nr:FtsX-like permease family protein [Rhodoblastus sp.]
MKLLATILSFARRDLRGGLKGFRVFLVCVAIGVAAVTSVTAVSQSLLASFAAQGRSMLGGDLTLARSLRMLTPDERVSLSSLGRLSEIAILRAMARTPDDRAVMVDAKVVDDSYPLVGQLTLEPDQPLGRALASDNGVYGAVADATFIERAGLKIGDRFDVGNAHLVLKGEIRSEPDRIATGIGFGSRVMISRAAFEASGLGSTASLTRWVTRLALANPDVDDNRVKAIADDILKRFPTAGWDARTRANVSPQLTRNVDRFTQFMALIGVVSLIVGGVGVSIAVGAFVDRKRESIAILKAVGASGGVAFTLVLVEMMLIAFAGALIGAAIGAASPFIAAYFAGPAIDLPFAPVFSGRAIAAGIAIGLLAALTFVVAPAGRAHDTPVAVLFRSTATMESGRLRARYVIGALVAFAAMIGLVYVLSTEKQIALMAIAGVAAAAAVLRAVGWAVAHGAAFGANIRNLPARLAFGNIRRPGAVTRPVVTSLGLGLTLLVVIVGVDGNVQRQLKSGDPGRTPDYFFADVQSSQADAFREMLKERRPDAAIEQVPMLRGRIVRVGARRAEDVKAEQNAAWVLDGDRGVTYAATPPPGSTVIAGKWWPADYKGPPLVSLDGDIARGLGLSVGDEIAVNVMGREIAAKIANLREVDWRSFGINFVLVFTPSTFAGAPHTELISLTMPPGAPPASGTLVSDVSKAYPTVVTLAVREALQQALSLTEKISTAIRAASSVTLVTALLTLVGALAAGQRARLYDAVVLRMLGATRRRLILAYLIEFLTLGAATSVFALAAGSIAAQLIVTRLMKLDFVFDWPGLVAIVVIGCLTTIALGLVATWRTLGAKPARVLREL